MMRFIRTSLAGQTIVGRVVVELKDKLKIMALKLELVGKGKVRWSHEHYFCDRRIPLNNSLLPEEETYIYQKKYLIGERAESPIVLQPGVHSFPYYFTLSPWLPSSFEGRDCHIRYSLQATLERVLFKDVKSDPLKFLIKGILDLNQYPGVSRPFSVCELKQWDFLCWKLWSVALNLSVDKIGFIPGENLKFLVKLNNSCSNVQLAPVKAYLIKKVITKAAHAKRSYEHKIVRLKGPHVEAGVVESWTGQFDIPYMEPTGLGLYPSQLLRFDLQYYIKVVAKNVFSTISQKIGLTIGTIPLRATSVGGSDLTSSEMAVTFLGCCQQYTPYRNLSNIFPAIANNNPNATNNSGNSANITLSNHPTNLSFYGSNTLLQFDESSNLVVTLPSPSNEEPENETPSSILMLADGAKTPLKRTDTPPPSYEEAIKKSSFRK